MRKEVWVIIGVVIAIALGIALWFALGASNNNNGSTSDNSSARADKTGETEVDVTIQNYAFSPAHIKIKKGTTVVWTNRDEMGHNAVAEDSGNTGGLPTDTPTYKAGETQRVTFNEVGTFKYHCQPHEYMKGSIEVVE